MSDFKKSHPRLAAALWLLIVFALAFDVAFLWQRASGAYTSEFGAHPDEAAHYVTGLFVRDAITAVSSTISQRSTAPLKAFGPAAPGGFYEHYPKVALGVWPPGFYVAQSAWTLPFGVSRTSILILMAMLAGGVGVLMYRILRPEFGVFAGFLGLLLWLCAPLVRTFYGMVMAEMLSTFLMLSATIFWGRYLDEGRTSDAVRFGLLAAIAILTKGTGLALVLMVVFSILLAKKWNVFRCPGPWIAAGLVAFIAGPWTWYFRKAGTQVGGWADNSGGSSLSFTLAALPYYARHLALATGFAVIAFAVVGIYARVVRRGSRNGRWTAIASLVFGVFIFQCLIPVGLESRHIISATPALVLLAVAGAVWVARLPRFRASLETAQPRRDGMWVAILALLSLPILALAHVEKAFTGFGPIADWLVVQAPRARILVCSDAVGEGMFISEVTMLDKRPGLTVERASKTLVSEEGRTWEGNNLRTRFDDAKLLEYLSAGKIDYIVLDSAVPDRKRSGYHDQLARVIETNQSRFWRVLENPIVRDGEAMYRPLRLFRVTDGAKPISK